jgi:hypothetical protein
MNLIGSLKQEKRVKEIVLKAMGQAISKTVAITEIIKVGMSIVTSCLVLLLFVMLSLVLVTIFLTVWFDFYLY